MLSGFELLHYNSDETEYYLNIVEKIENRIPLGKRMTTKEELGAMVAFLLSSKSSHTTGQLIHVDGGYVHLDRSLI